MGKDIRRILWLEIVIVGVMLLLTTAIIDNNITRSLTQQLNNRAYVQALCDWSHYHDDGSLEQRCGEAQDTTHTEYLCVTRSTDLNCWVEQK